MKRIRIKTMLASLILFFVINSLGAYPGFHVKFTAAIISYGLIVYLLLKKVHNKRAVKNVLMTFFLPPALLLMPVHVVNFELTRVSFPSSLAIFIGILWGHFLYKTKDIYLRIGLSTLLLTLSFWVTTTGYDAWLLIVKGDFFSDTSEKFADVQLIDSNGDTLQRVDFAGQIAVFDFWNTKCGVCFKKFPKLEELSKKYYADARVGVYAVNIPLSLDSPGMAQRMMEERGYTFSNLYALDPSAKDSFRVESFPECLIVLGGSQVVYRGSIERINQKLEELLQE